ncbi:MAG: phosphatase PAP2-related protein [Bacteroidota bacterium]
MSLRNLIITWKNELSNRNFRILFIISIISAVVVITSFTNYRIYNEARMGFTFTDPFQVLFSPIDLTWSTFTLIYGGLFLGIYYFIQKPHVFVHALLTYSILVLFRIILMYSLPLDPPLTMISLRDPFVELLGSGPPLDKDLFFSGHTATMFMLFLLSYTSVQKKIFLVGSILVGLSVVLQHNHYTVDALVAPFIAYASYRIALHIMNLVIEKTD